MPHKPKPNPFSEITNLYSNPDGLMHNAKADAVLATTVTRKGNNARKCQLRYGMHQDERQIKIVKYKDENGEWQKRKIYVRSTVKYTERDLDSDKTLGYNMIDGEYIDQAEIEARGWTTSGFLQMAKKDARVLNAT